MATTAASAYDLMLVCERPGAFYRAMSRAGYLHRSPVLLGLLDGLLPPTQIRLVHGAGLVKASVLSLAAFQRATSAARRDQFVAGRLFQDVHVVWVGSPEAARQVEDAIDSARRVTLDWVAPDLPARFSASEYVRQLFRTSFRFEVRPETGGRADALFDAQAGRLVPAFEGVLKDLVASGRLRATEDGAFSLPGPPPRGQILRRRLYLEWSRVRATARWPKHAVTFDGWLDYIIRKAERHSGETIVLTPLERRFPLILLWPKIFKFLARQRGKGRPV
ncbi:MAG TPA: hypothetical protein PLD86_16770 [Vicinamibacteria bacterium]|nr:hypothetical protein [Vicinamibacteria bacterium]